MHRLYEFQREDEIDIANRIALLIHKTLDESFPNSRNASPRFGKTAFSPEDTLIQGTPASSKSQSSPKFEAPSDPAVGEIAPVSEFGEFAYSRIEKTALERPRKSLLKKILFLILVTTVLTLIAAYWVNQMLMMD
jgi:hypothetical protein